MGELGRPELRERIGPPPVSDVVGRDRGQLAIGEPGPFRCAGGSGREHHRGRSVGVVGRAVGCRPVSGQSENVIGRGQDQVGLNPLQAGVSLRPGESGVDTSAGGADLCRCHVGQNPGRGRRQSQRHQRSGTQPTTDEARRNGVGTPVQFQVGERCAVGVHERRAAAEACRGFRHGCGQVAGTGGTRSQPVTGRGSGGVTNSDRGLTGAGSVCGHAGDRSVRP